MNVQKLVFILFVAAFISCHKDEPNPSYTPPDSSFGLIYQKVFTPSCAFVGCHANESHDDHSHGVTLQGPDTYAGMINVNPKNSLAVAAKMKLIVPGDTLNSFMYQKLIYNRSTHKYGAPMPGGGLYLTENQITFIRQWITAGAPLEGHVADKSLIN